MTKNKLCEALHPEMLFNYFAQGETRLAIRMGEPLKVVCHIRDEAHRFGITFHRQKRNNALITSELDSIEGIGEKSRNALLRHFKSVRKIKEATLEELATVVGTSRATAIRNHFHKE